MPFTFKSDVTVQSTILVTLKTSLSMTKDCPTKSTLKLLHIRSKEIIGYENSVTVPVSFLYGVSTFTSFSNNS